MLDQRVSLNETLHQWPANDVESPRHDGLPQLTSTYSRPNLTDFDFSDFQLRGDFRGADLTGAKFIRARIISANFSAIEVVENCMPPRLGEGDMRDLFGRGGTLNRYPTILNDTDFTGALVEASAFDQATAVALVAKGAAFSRCNFNETNFSEADFLDSHFYQCDTRGVQTHRARLPTNTVFDTHTSLEVVLVFASFEAIVVLGHFSFEALGSSQDAARTGAAILGGLTLLVLTGWWRLWIAGRVKHFELPTCVLFLLAVEAAVEVFRLLLEPFFHEIPPGVYVGLMWFISLGIFLFVRYIRYRHVDFRTIFKEVKALRPDIDFITFLSIPTIFTAFYIIVQYPHLAARIGKYVGLGIAALIAFVCIMAFLFRGLNPRNE